MKEMFLDVVKRARQSVPGLARGDQLVKLVFFDCGELIHFLLPEYY